MDLELYTMTIKDCMILQEELLTNFDSFWTVSTLQKELENPNSMYLVAKQKEEIVGFGGIWKSVDDVHITNIVIRKDKRNLGIASIILEKLIDITKSMNFASITLEVNENNFPAIALYKKYHFQTLGIRKKYYNHKDNAIIMTRYL